MARNKAQLLRLIFIDHKIRQGMKSGHLANCQSMAAEYEVSYKSIQRDIDYMKNQMAAPIAYDAGRRGFFYTEENYALPALSMSESDLFAIFIAEQALQQYKNTPVYDKLRRVFAKIAESLPDGIHVDPQLIDQRFSFKAAHHTVIDPAVWEKVSLATRRRHPLSLVYQKPDGSAPSQRRVDPYRMISYEGEWYIRGYCHSRRRVLTFALARIRAVSVEAKAALEEREAAGEQEEGFGIFSGNERYMVRIRFARKEAAYVRERIWHPAQRFRPGPDDSVILEFPAAHLREVKRWVLSWGDGATVEAPPELVDTIRRELAGMCHNYRMTT